MMRIWFAWISNLGASLSSSPVRDPKTEEVGEEIEAVGYKVELKDEKDLRGWTHGRQRIKQTAGRRKEFRRVVTIMNDFLGILNNFLGGWSGSFNAAVKSFGINNSVRGSIENLEASHMVKAVVTCGRVTSAGLHLRPSFPSINHAGPLHAI